jgi:uncharacterized protein (DUF1778 family)
MQIRVNSENAPAVKQAAKDQTRSASFVVNEALKKARKAGILKDPPKAKH